MQLARHHLWQIMELFQEWITVSAIQQASQSQ